MGQERLLLSTCERSGGNWGKGICKTNLTNQMYQFSSLVRNWYILADFLYFLSGKKHLAFR